MLFKSSIGIEINDHEVNLVYLKGSFRGVHPAAESHCQLDTAKTAADRQSDIISYINGFIREQNITAADIFMGIPGDSAMMREISLPLAVKENLRKTLAYEIEKYIPVSGDDVYFDYLITAESKEEEILKLLLVAVKKDALTDYLEIAAHIDTGVSGIGIVPAAVANYYRYHHESLKVPSLVVYSRRQVCDAVILKDRSMVYAKSFVAAGASGNKPAVDSDQLVRLREIFFPEAEPVNLVLYGLPASDARLSRMPNTFPNIISGNTHAADREQFIPAFGFALNGIPTVAVEINLMPVRLRKKPNKTGLYIMMGLTVLLVLAGVLWTGSHVVRQRQILHALDAELSRLRTEASEIEQIQSQTIEMKKNMAYVQSLRPGNAFALEIINELSKLIPSDAWLTDLKITGDKVNIYGSAASATELISLLDQSPFFEKVEFISTIRKDRDGKELFRIGCTIQAGSQGE